MLTGLNDLDLLIVDHLEGKDIQNLNKVVKLKDGIYWKEKLKQIITIENDVNPSSWKFLYLEFIEFYDFYILTYLYSHLTMGFDMRYNPDYFLYILGKDKNLENIFSYKEKGFFPLIGKMMDFINVSKDMKKKSPEDIKKYLNLNKEFFLQIRKEFSKIYYIFPHTINFFNLNCLLRETKFDSIDSEKIMTTYYKVINTPPIKKITLTFPIVFNIF